MRLIESSRIKPKPFLRCACKQTGFWANYLKPVGSGLQEYVNRRNLLRGMALMPSFSSSVGLAGDPIQNYAVRFCNESPVPAQLVGRTGSSRMSSFAPTASAKSASLAMLMSCRALSICETSAGLVPHAFCHLGFGKSCCRTCGNELSGKIERGCQCVIGSQIVEVTQPRFWIGKVSFLVNGILSPRFQ